MYPLLGISNTTTVFGLDSLPSKVDYCDLLLDAIDAQLDQLQVSYCQFDCLSVSFDI